MTNISENITQKLLGKQAIVFTKEAIDRTKRRVFLIAGITPFLATTGNEITRYLQTKNFSFSNTKLGVHLAIDLVSASLGYIVIKQLFDWLEKGILRVQREFDTVQKSEDFFQRLIDTLPIALHYNSVDEQYIITNKTYQEFLELSKQFLLDVEPQTGLQKTIPQNNLTVKELQFQNPKNGERKTFQIIQQQVESDNRDPQGTLELVIDITSTRQMEALRGAQRILFHDVVNPLGAIFGRAQLLREDHYDPKKMSEGLLQIEHLVARIVAMMNEQGELALLEEGAYQPHKEWIQISDLFSEVERELQGLLDTNHIKLVCSLKKEGAISVGAHLAFLDKKLLRMALNNLVKNSIEATPPGGEVSLEFEELSDKDRITVSNPGQVPKDIQTQFFKKGITSKTTGSGLGTHIASRATEAHKGSISLDVGQEGMVKVIVDIPKESRYFEI